MGFADIEIIDGRTIQFAGGGLKTDVGTRVASTTVGLDIEGAGFGMNGALMQMQKPKNRVTMSKKAPRRKAKGSDWLTDLTSVRGMKL